MTHDTIRDGLAFQVAHNLVHIDNDFPSGVFETLKELAKMVLAELKKGS